MKRIGCLIQFLVMAFFAQAQVDSFDVFTFKPPEFFTISRLPSQVQCSMKNNDTSFCLITLYKSGTVQKKLLQDISNQWNEQVVKRFSKADKKPQRIYTQQLWDGWASTVAIGNCMQNKKKVVVMLNSFRSDKTTACIVFAFSDKIFKGPVENFSQNLHLKQLYSK
jgi:hypothetical protein